MSKAIITYADACSDARLFGPWFSADSWSTWRAIDKAIFGLPMSDEERYVFEELTGRTEAPTEPAREAWLIFGRRGGKDVKAASYAVYLATIGSELYGYRKRLTRGERGVVQVLAVDRDQAKVCFDYVKAMLEMPMLAKMVKRVSSDSIDLTNQISIEITTNDKRRVRGRTVICAIFDEVAHWRSDSTANPDEDVYQALTPAMATIPNALLIGISSPYSRRGLLWRKYQSHWSKDGRVIVARAPTWRMNPTVPRDGDFIKEQFAKNAAWASGEYGAEWRADLEEFVSLDVVKACIVPGARERAPDRQIDYVAFTDPSGGSKDSMTLSIAHKEGVTAVLDLVRERKAPFSPEQVVEEFADTLKAYRVSRVSGDHYAGEWPREAFRRHGINYEPADRTKSELYQSLLPLLNSRAVDLLDNDVLVTQLVSLECSTTRGGRDRIDHPDDPNCHDDLANAVAGALALASKKSGNSSWNSASTGLQRMAVMGHPTAKKRLGRSQYQRGGIGDGEIVRSIMSLERDVVSREFELERMDRLGTSQLRQGRA